MPRYLKVDGRVVDEYAVGPSVAVRVVESGESYVYCVSVPQYSEEDLAAAEEVLEEVVYELKPRELDEKLEKYLRDRGLEEKLVYLIKSRVAGYGWLEPFMLDPRLEDIHCFRPGHPVKVVHRDYGLMDSNVVPSREEVDFMVRLLAYRAGSSVSVLRPVRDTVILPTGDRAALVYRSEVSESSSFTVRKFPRDPWTPTKLLSVNTASPEALAFLWLAVEHRVPILVCGRMRTGKTSLSNALCMFIPPDSSLCLVQDSPEMKVFHSNLLSLFTSDRVGFEELAKLALRRSVDYIVVNEVRVREEAYWWAQLVGTGHGGITTIHSDSPAMAFARLKDMGVEESLASAVRVVVRTELYRGEASGRKVRARRVDYVGFLLSLEGWRPETAPCYTYSPSEDRLERREGLREALGYLEEVAGRSLEAELKEKAFFLDLAARAGVLSAQDFWKTVVSYRRRPRDTLRELEERAVLLEERNLVLQPPRLKILEGVKYCPRCGAELRGSACPRCGFKISVLAGETGV